MEKVRAKGKFYYEDKQKQKPLDSIKLHHLHKSVSFYSSSTYIFSVLKYILF